MGEHLEVPGLLRAFKAYKAMRFCIFAVDDPRALAARSTASASGSRGLDWKLDGIEESAVQTTHAADNS